MKAKPDKSSSPKKRWKKEVVFWLSVFVLLFICFFLLRYCSPEDIPTGTSGTGKHYPSDTSYLLEVDTLEPEEPEVLVETTVVKVPEPKKLDSLPKDTVEKVSLKFAGSKVEGEDDFIDTLYVWADPWGGRHFDSVQVQLFCKEDCDIVYSFVDEQSMQSYHKPLMIITSTTLWIAGINEKGEQSIPVKVKYTIERKRGKCPDNMMPYTLEGKEYCMDVYEWPNKNGEVPVSFVKWKEASGMCEEKNKRLCTIDEWQMVCRGPENLKYPYSEKYDENGCPAKEKKVQRSGRFPVCRSYYGIFDLSGNLWEWTASPSESKEGHYWVAGGNWESGNQATCVERKYSFYPQNKYPFVGFRCCKDI